MATTRPDWYQAYAAEHGQEAANYALHYYYSTWYQQAGAPAAALALARQAAATAAADAAAVGQPELPGQSALRDTLATTWRG